MITQERTRRFPEQGKSAWEVFPIAKSLIDFILASVCLVICLPLFALIALAIKIDFRGPIFCCQKWVDGNGSTLHLLRFRSIKPGAESHISPVWVRNDSSLTRIGRIIVKLGIDEIPQIINVLRGEMSLIDPQPMRPCFDK